MHEKVFYVTLSCTDSLIVYISEFLLRFVSGVRRRRKKNSFTHIFIYSRAKRAVFFKKKSPPCNVFIKMVHKKYCREKKWHGVENLRAFFLLCLERKSTKNLHMKREAKMKYYYIVIKNVHPVRLPPQLETFFPPEKNTC